MLCVSTVLPKDGRVMSIFLIRLADVGTHKGKRRDFTIVASDLVLMSSSSRYI